MELARGNRVGYGRVATDARPGPAWNGTRGVLAWVDSPLPILLVPGLYCQWSDVFAA
jgi:hypothetical protein